MRNLIASTLLSALVLSGCGNDTESFATARAMKTTVSDRVSGAGKAKPAAAPPQITRAILAQILTPVQLVTLEKRKQQAVIGPVATNQGVETWSSVDKVTISFRKGVIVATRGLGADLMAADVPAVATLTGATSAYGRIHTELNGLDQAVRTSYSCQVTERNAQAIEVVEISYPTTYIRETCTSSGATFANEYWIDKAQKIRKSKQWISEEVGYVTIQDLRP